MYLSNIMVSRHVPWHVPQFTREYPEFPCPRAMQPPDALHAQIAMHVYRVTWQCCTWYWANCNAARFGEPSQLWKTFLLTWKHHKHDATPFWKLKSACYWDAWDRNAACHKTLWLGVFVFIGTPYSHSGDVINKLETSETVHFLGDQVWSHISRITIFGWCTLGIGSRKQV